MQAHFLLRVAFLTCGAVVSLGELDLDLVLPGDVLDAATFRPHDGAVVSLRDCHLHAHLGLLHDRGEEERRQLGNTLNYTTISVLAHDEFFKMQLVLTAFL